MSIGAVIFGIVGIILIGMLYLGVGFKAITSGQDEQISSDPIVASAGGLRRRHRHRRRGHRRRIK